MTFEIDIRDANHPECKEQLVSELERAGIDEDVIVLSDHDPEPALRQYEAENNQSIEWTYDKEGPEEWRLTVTKNKLTGNATFDAREYPPPERHGTILEMFQELGVGESFVLINDHDPKPLFYELGSIHGDTFDWDYINKEKQEYRVKITKTDESREMPEEASTRVDVRMIPPNDRHKTIFHRFDLLAANDAMEIVADHDPEPLRYQLREIHGEDAFEWDYRRKNSGEVRVLLTKTNSSTGNGAERTENSTGAPEKMLENAEELDVRSYEPQKRHDLIFKRYQSLEEGEGFVLVNDHDPKPLYYQMNEEMEGNLTWEYLEQGGEEWKVLIGK